MSVLAEEAGPDARREVYSCDVVFGAINEIGFDVLRDQLITRREDAVRTPADVAVVDEADSVMVDEALVPLVLAGSEPGAGPPASITGRRGRPGDREARARPRPGRARCHSSRSVR